MNNVEKELVQDFSLWRVKNNRNETTRKSIYKDTEDFMEERFQIKPTPSQTPITILDILNTMIGPDVDASIAANSVRQHIMGCQESTAQDACVYSCSLYDFKVSGNRCFHLSSSDATAPYDQAMLSCVNRGAKLATVNSATNNNFVKQLIQESGLSASVIIGLNDVANEGTFRWQNDDTVAWTSGQSPLYSGQFLSLAHCSA